MAYIRGDRQQTWLMPPSVEDYIPATDPVRAYDAFIEALDLKELGFELDDNKVGPPEFEPRAMLKLLVYAYSYGLRGSRKIERACHHNLSFIWLTGNLRPDHKTICRFRRDHQDQLARLLKQCARLCIKLNLIEGNTLFVDGTKIKANASIDKTWSKERCESLLKDTDHRIEKLFADIEQIDQNEEHRESLVQLENDLANKQALQQRVASVLNQLNQQNKDILNTTDPDCAKVKDKQTFVAGYNMQTVVDNKNGLIVHTDVVAEANNNIGGTCTTERGQ
jgi:transposase